MYQFWFVFPFTFKILFMFLFFTCLLAYANPSPEVSQIISQYNKVGSFSLPVLSESQERLLHKGNVVTIINNDNDNSGRLVGYMLTSASLEQLWIGTQDPHFQVQSRAKDLLLKDLGKGDMIWYAYADMPFPFADRHWVNLVTEEEFLLPNTNDRVWEHSWKLMPDGLKMALPMIEKGALQGVKIDMTQKAIYLPKNNGSWIGIEMGEQNLYVYYVALDFGGAIPEDIMLKYIKSGLPKMLLDINKRALGAGKHYQLNHEHVIFGGDKKPIKQKNLQ